MEDSHRTGPTEDEQLDEALDESFPASDPPATWSGPDDATPPDPPPATAG